MNTQDVKEFDSLGAAFDAVNFKVGGDAIIEYSSSREEDGYRYYHVSDGAAFDFADIWQNVETGSCTVFYII